MKKIQKIVLGLWLFVTFFISEIKNYCVSLRYFAIELFDATLKQFCNGQYTGLMLSDA
jgi:hypothetical protein